MNLRHRILKTFLQGTVAFYRGLPAVFLKGQCRFLPTCADYAQQAIHTQPPPKAAALIARRLLRCHPFARGGWDPI